MNASSSDLEICLSLLVCKLLLNGSTLKMFAQLEKPHSGQYLVSLLRLILGRHLRRNAELIDWQDGQHVVRPFSTTHGRRGRHGGERHLPVRQLLLPFHELGYMLRRSVELCLNNRTSNVTKLIISSQELPARIISALGDRLRKLLLSEANRYDMECSNSNLHYSMSSGFVDADGVSLLSGGGTLVLETHDAVRY